MHVIIIAIGMCTNPLMLTPTYFRLHIFKNTAHKELKLRLHILQSIYITIVE